MMIGNNLIRLQRLLFSIKRSAAAISCVVIPHPSCVMQHNRLQNYISEEIITFGKTLIMPSINQNISIADYYFGFLNNLNSNSKLDLISKLSQSLKESDRNQEASLQSLFGAYKSNETAEEIIAEIRESRVFNRNTESL